MLALHVAPARAHQWALVFAARMPGYGVDTPQRQAQFLGQVLHESGCLRHVRENMNYSAERLRQVFPRYFTEQQAFEYARMPERIGSRVYAGRMGNGDEASGDGYRYRGRGFIQLTGRNNYAAFAECIGDDVVASPDKVATLYPVDAALWFWQANDLNRFADRGDGKGLTRRVNGGYNGLQQRLAIARQASDLMLA